jgi:predicted MFS family arabinose efflux permease
MSDGEEAGAISRGRAWAILAVLAAVQFVTIVDFMVIMPLEPQLSRAMSLTTARFGFVVSAYTIAAGLAGLVATMVVDRLPRRTAFLVIFAGFLVGTLSCGLAPGYRTLLLARFLTGAFGGILGGLAMAVIGDVFPEFLRGTATGALMSAFALASIAGIPLGLAIGQRFGWQAPFLALALLGLPILVASPLLMPRLDGHMLKKGASSPLGRLAETFSHPNHLRAFALTIALTFSGFAVIPFISPYLVANVGVSEKQLPWVYVVGGALTLVGAPVVGRLSDRFGKLPVFLAVAPASAVLMLVITNLGPSPFALALVVTGVLMLSNAGRMVPAMAMITSSVEPHRRGGFLGANSAVQHLSAGVGSAMAGLILSKSASGALLHYPRAGLIGAAATLVSLYLAGRLRPAGVKPSPTLVNDLDELI